VIADVGDFARSTQRPGASSKGCDPKRKIDMAHSPAVALSSSEPALQNWPRVLARYREPNQLRSTVEIAITLVPLAVLWTLAWAAVHFGYWWLSPLLTLPAAGFLVRLFMIQHDCGHGSFFRQRAANDWVGRVIGVLTLTPYDFWRRTHAIHHAGSGHLERRGIGDVDTLTVGEYLSLSFWRRLRYRAYRHPLVMFGIGPAYLFILQHRLPVGLISSGWRPWLSAMATNLAIAAVVAGLIHFIGIGPFLLVELPTILLAGSIGVWLFYVQHQFETTFWAHEGEWTFQEAALHGSSHYDLPSVLRWFTANIGVHHVHHLCSRIPSYRLPRVLGDHPELRGIGRLTLPQSLRCVSLVLWDDGQRRLISFREMNRRRAAIWPPACPFRRGPSSQLSTQLPTLLETSRPNP
jgi:omega-6 fatty acid desaturase (delta-12 desaturase)